VGAALVEQANAKINLTLRVIGRRADGFHELESLVAFADLSDVLALEPGAVASLDVSGPFADAAGAQADNLVLKAARALGVPGGHFKLTKNIPVAAGLGGGSADAAAALRALATANNIPSARVMEAACRVGADVPVCLDPRPRVMQGIGEVLSPPVTMPKLAAVLVNPGVAAATKDVFAKLDLSKCGKMPLEDIPSDRMAFVAMLAKRTNDLTLPALAVAPVIADVLSGLSKSAGNLLARMSGSGATCFGIYASSAEAEAAARQLSAAQPKWWVRATAIGDPLS
jgi:4-diphosphocytidyl-2-C-methyl-D-erythritol kinase